MFLKTANLELLEHVAVGQPNAGGCTTVFLDAFDQRTDPDIDAMGAVFCLVEA
jgi:hypothetical protein